MRRSIGAAVVLVLAGCVDPVGVAPPVGRDAGRDSGLPSMPGPDAGTPPIDPGVIRAEVPPPPITGGTLAISADGAIAVAADPDLDTIFVVDLAAGTSRAVALTRGDEPGRVALDAAGRAHVVLRRAGAIADVDLATASLLDRRPVCAAPRGIAYRGSDDSLHVACLDDLLVSLPASGGAPTRSLEVEGDLRDVLVRGDDLFVTRFRSAALLRVGADGALASERRPGAISPPLAMRVTEEGPFEPAVAWRAVAAESGVLMLHQRAFSGEFFAEAGYGGTECGQSIVHTAVTRLADDGAVSMGAALDRVVLGVDVAISPDGARIAIASPANAYAREGGGEILTFARDHADVMLFRTASLEATAPETGCARSEAPPALAAEGGAVVAVAFLPDGRLVAQTRAPAVLLLEGTEAGVLPAIALSETSAFDTGHAIFHARTSGSLACASCHPEGGDDARVWRFAGIGPRRTQTMRGGLLDTAPFHWDGDMDSFATLVHSVFGGRMGGALHSEQEIPALGEWMDTLAAFPRPAVADPAAVERGEAIFHDPSVGCATCHAGPALTSNASVAVGTGGLFQVPTLLGIAYRAPYMHDGCAATLRDRFGACGGGDVHGRTSHLTSAQLDDLVAYLRTL